jgi:NAD(P)-dependent dehydrogenase (short-subunit alcohol dehydrogenase family)
MLDLSNKVIALAGGAGGIGGATSRLLAKQGASVVVGDLNFEDAETVAKAIRAEGGKAIAVPLDVGEDASVRELIAAAVAEFGGLDGVHFNAAERSLLRSDTTVVDIEIEHWDTIQRVTLRGGMLAARYAIPELLKRGGGSIVFTSSAAGFKGLPNVVAYSTAKAGLHAIVRHVATTWGKQGVRANAVAPGSVVTPHHLKVFDDATRAERLSGAFSQRLGRPDDIASMVAMLMSDDGSWIQGQVISIDGGSTMR